MQRDWQCILTTNLLSTIFYLPLAHILLSCPALAHILLLCPAIVVCSRGKHTCPLRMHDLQPCVLRVGRSVVKYSNHIGGNLIAVYGNCSHEKRKERKEKEHEPPEATPHVSVYQGSMYEDNDDRVTVLKEYYYLDISKYKNISLV